MAEGMKLLEEHMATGEKYGHPKARLYMPLFSPHDSLHTVVVEAEWKSMAAIEEFSAKMAADPERQKQMAGLEAVIETTSRELLVDIGELFIKPIIGKLDGSDKK